LYYWLAAALQMGVGAGFGPGRVLSLAAGAATAATVGVLAGRRAGGVWVGVFAALLFLALAFPGPTPWLGLYRVDQVGVALSVAAIAVLSRTSRTPISIAAGVLAGLALLTKQTFVAALIAGVLWRWLDGPRANAYYFGGAAGLTFAIPCLVLEASTGAFFQNTVAANVNPVFLSVAAGLLPEFLSTQWPMLLLAGIYLGMQPPWRGGEARLLVLYWALSSVVLLGLAKIGANVNYWIEFAAATAILAARGAACLLALPRPYVAGLAAAGLVLIVAAHLGGPVALLASARAIRADVRTLANPPRDADFESLVERVRTEPGVVIAEPGDVVVLAGRQVLLEPFIYSILLDAGRWRPEPLVAQICHGEIRLVILAYSLEVGAQLSDGLIALWPAPVIAALQDSMALERMQAARYVYRPRLSPAGGCSA
jgi:hypothetical protein